MGTFNTECIGLCVSNIKQCITKNQENVRNISTVTQRHLKIFYVKLSHCRNMNFYWEKHGAFFDHKVFVKCRKSRYNSSFKLLKKTKILYESTLGTFICTSYLKIHLAIRASSTETAAPALS